MIKNYTSTVPAERSVARIELLLVRAGAENILKDYREGKLVALNFLIFHPGMNQKIAIRLPANAEAIRTILKAETKRPREKTFARIDEQADRTAWKLIQDWVEVQISLIELGQAEFLQVFLPYVWNGKQTFYASLKDSGFKLLGSGER